MNSNEDTYENYLAYMYEVTHKRDIEMGVMFMSREDWEKAKENEKNTCGWVDGWD